MNGTFLNFALFALLGFVVGWGLEFVIDLLFWRRRPARKQAAPPAVGGASAAETDEEPERLRLALAERDEALLQAHGQATARGEELASAKLLIQDYDNTITHLKQELEGYQAEFERLRTIAPADELAARDVQIATLRAQLDSTESAVADLRRQVAQRNAELEALREQQIVGPQPGALESLQAEVASREAELDGARAALQSELAAKTAELEKVRAELEARMHEAVEVESYLQERDAEIARLTERLGEATAELDHFRQRELDQLIIGETERTREDEEEAERAQARDEPIALVPEYEEETEPVPEDEEQIELVQEDEEEAEPIQARDEPIAFVPEYEEEAELIQEPEEQAEPIQEAEFAREDDLTVIKGIGGVYAEKLREAGFYTFRDLAEADTEELGTVLDIPVWRVPNLQDWIDQARELAEQKEQEEE